MLEQMAPGRVMSSDLQSLAQLGVDNYCNADIKRGAGGAAQSQHSTGKVTVEASEQRAVLKDGSDSACPAVGWLARPCFSLLHSR